MRTHKTSSYRVALIAALLSTSSLYAGDALAVDQDECGDLDYKGVCIGDLVRWCEDGVVHETNCAAIESTCGWNEEGGYFGCLPAALAGAEEGCGDGLTWEGTCDTEARVIWCQDGDEASLECKPGTHCGWSPDGYYDCLVDNGGEGGGYGGGGGAGGNGDSGATPENTPGGSQSSSSGGTDPAQPAPKAAASAEPHPPTTEKPPSDPGGSSSDDSTLLPSPTASEPAAGCAGTSGAQPGLLALLLLTILLLGRRADGYARR